MEALFLKIFNMSISAIWLILAVAVLRLMLKKAPKAIAVVLWGMVAFKLIIPISFESSLSVVPSGETIPQNIAISDVPSIDSGVGVIDRVINPVIIENFSPEKAEAGASINPMQTVLFIAAVVWALGVLCLIIYSLISYAVIAVKVKASINTKENIYVCDDIQSPFILGLLRPRIYLPSSLTEEQYMHVVSHEQAHIKRRDYLWKPIGFAVLALHWFNPLVWVGYVLLCRDIEFACDEKVVKNMGESEVKQYSQTLLSCSVLKRMITACPVAFGETGVKQRIKNVLNYKKPMFWVIIIAVIACIVTAVLFLTSPPRSENAGESDPVSFEAIVLENEQSRLLVEPLEGTSERRSSDKIYVSIPDSNTEEYKINSKIKVTYDGMIQELYPAIIPNVFGIELVTEGATLPEVTDTFVVGNIAYNWRVFRLTGYNSLKSGIAERYVVANKETNIIPSKAKKVYRFDSVDQLTDEVADAFGDLNTNPLLRINWNYEYNNEYFADKSIFFIYCALPSGSISIDVTDVKVTEDGKVNIVIEKNTPESGDDMMNYLGIVIEVDKASISGTVGCSLNEIEKNDNNLAQKNIVNYVTTDFLSKPVGQYSIQAIGILDKDDEMFTESESTDLFGSEFIHLPVRIIESYDEYKAFMKKYGSIADAELPSEMRNVSGITKLTFTSKNNYVAVIYVDPTMVPTDKYLLYKPMISQNSETMSFALCSERVDLYRGQVDLTNKNFGWLMMYEIPAESFDGIKSIDAVVCESIEKLKLYSGD